MDCVALLSNQAMYHFFNLNILLSGAGKLIRIVILLLPVSGHQAHTLSVYCTNSSFFAGIYCVPNAHQVPAGSESGNGLHSYRSYQQHLPGGPLCSICGCTEAGSCVSDGKLCWP